MGACIRRATYFRTPALPLSEATPARDQIPPELLGCTIHLLFIRLTLSWVQRAQSSGVDIAVWRLRKAFEGELLE